MTQEDKELLLKYLCMSLPYGVIMNTPNDDGHLCSINQTIFGNEYGINISATRRDYFNDEKLNFKPYLRTMSSMTNVEREEYGLMLCGELSTKPIDWLLKNHFDFMGLIPKDLAIEVTNKNNPYKE